MNMIFRIMMFSIMLNFSVGIMMEMIVDKDGNKVFDASHARGLTYSENYTDGFTTLEEDVNPSGTLEDKGNAIYRILDTITLGFIGRLIEIGNTYGFGFINMLQAMLGGIMGEGSTIIFGFLKIIVTIGYILGGWWLWTGKNLNENT